MTPFILPKPKGFTLLELIVVLLVVSLFTVMIVVNVSPGDKNIVKNQANRLYQTLLFAQDKAIMQSVEIGFSTSETAYSFSVLKDAQWLPLSTERPLVEYAFGEDVYLQMTVENEAVVMGQAPHANDKPMVLLLSSGEVTPFEVTLAISETDDVLFKIIGTSAGEIRLSPQSDV